MRDPYSSIVDLCRWLRIGGGGHGGHVATGAPEARGKAMGERREAGGAAGEVKDGPERRDTLLRDWRAGQRHPFIQNEWISRH
jgi:hypothetical protein